VRTHASRHSEERELRSNVEGGLLPLVCFPLRLARGRNDGQLRVNYLTLTMVRLPLTMLPLPHRFNRKIII
jgi:hypothetical protein